MATARADPIPVVLVVDDELIVLRAMGRALTEAGYKVHVASDTMLALDMLIALGTVPSVLVSDLRMEPLDGASFAKLVVGRWPATRVLIVSGWDPEHLVPGHQFLQKPFWPSQLVEAVAHLLALSATPPA